MCKYIYPFCKAINPACYAQFWPPLHQNTFGGRALSGSAGRVYSFPQNPVAGFGGRDGGNGRIRRGGKGEWWVRERAGGYGEGGIRRDKGRERDREREGMTRLTIHQC